MGGSAADLRAGLITLRCGRAVEPARSRTADSEPAPRRNTASRGPGVRRARRQPAKFGKHFHRDKEIYSRRPRQGNETRSRENRQGGRIAAGGRRATAKRAPPELGAARGMPGRGRPHSRDGTRGLIHSPMTNNFSSTERSSMSRRGGTDLLSVSRLWMGVCTQGGDARRRRQSDLKGNNAPGRMHGEHGTNEDKETREAGRL